MSRRTWPVRARPTPQRAGEILGELAASGQAPDVIQRVRQQLSHPNLLIEADERIVAAGIEDPVNDVGPLTDVILGTRISGTVQTVGYVNAELGNTAQYAAIDILMTGTAYSNTVGYNGPAVIHASGVTGLAGRKRLVLDANGLRSFPAASNARTSTTINGIGVTSKFMQGIDAEDRHQARLREQVAGGGDRFATRSSEIEHPHGCAVAESYRPGEPRFLEQSSAIR